MTGQEPVSYVSLVSMTRLHCGAVHPGSIMTNLARSTDREALRQGGFPDENGEPVIDPSRDLKTPEQGAATQVWCATSHRSTASAGRTAKMSSATVHDDGRPDTGVLAVTPGAFDVLASAIDQDAARRLWKLSEEILHRG